MTHNVYEIRVGSFIDETIDDRIAGGGMVLIQRLPLRGTYIIESRGVRSAWKKAERLARIDGVASPVMLSAELMNP